MTKHLLLLALTCLLNSSTFFFLSNAETRAKKEEGERENNHGLVCYFRHEDCALLFNPTQLKWNEFPLIINDVNVALPLHLAAT